MKQEQSVLVAVSSTLDRIRTEYAGLLQSTPLSLQELFEPENFRFDEFCKDFNPHPRSAELTVLAETFGREHGIWLPNAKHHVTCALYLYPTAEFDRMVAIMKNLVIGFYLNDVMGRDIFKDLSTDQKLVSRRIIQNMASLNENLLVPFGADRIETLNAEILTEFKDNSPAVWFSTFLKIYCHHLDITHTDRNVKALGHIPDLYEYIENRCHYAGVHHVVMWIEYNTGLFLDWGMLKDVGLYESFKRLHWLTAAFGCLSNDLFSFEKEVIDQESDSNLVMILVLNDPGLSLQGSITRSCSIVRALVLEFMQLMREAQNHPNLTANLEIHLTGICRCVQATWLWHCHSKRYKRPGSLWHETTGGK